MYSRPKKRSGESYKLVPCFYCQTDSTELKVFLIIVIGMLALSSCMIAIGTWLKGEYKNCEENKFDVINCEQEKE